MYREAIARAGTKRRKERRGSPARLAAATRSALQDLRRAWFDMNGDQFLELPLRGSLQSGKRALVPS
jgi:hypothetical protein